jgi:hypothetical protein
MMIDDRRPTTDHERHNSSGGHGGAALQTPCHPFTPSPAHPITRSPHHPLTAWIAERSLWLTLLVALALWTLAYQWPYARDFDIGGNTETRRREYDAPYLENFNESEPGDPPGDPEWWQLPQEPYRWTKDESAIHLPGAGGGLWVADIRARGQPGNPVTMSRWSDGATTADISIDNVERPRTYRMLVRPDSAGDITLRFNTPAYPGQGDTRTLGFVIYQARFTPADGLRLPALPQLGLLGATLALAYGAARTLRAPPRVTIIGAIVFAASLAILLALLRLGLTIFTPTLLAIAAACYALTLVLLRIPLPTRRPTPDARRPTPDARRPTKAFTRSHVHTFTPTPLLPYSPTPLLPTAAVALILLAFALRLVGSLHPHAIPNDLGLNANNLAAFTSGAVYDTESLPAESGGGRAPYPPGQYLVLALLQLLLWPDDVARRMIVRAGGALFDSLVVGLLWYVLWRAVGWRAALLGAALYIAPLPLLRSFWIGEHANIAGQALAMPALVLLVVGAHSLSRSRVLAVAVALLALAVLGHLGVTISLALMLVCLPFVWLVARGVRLPFGALMVVCVVAALLAGLFYYSAFGHLLAERLSDTATVNSTEPPKPFSKKLTNMVWGIGRPDNVLTPLMLGLGAAGVVALTRLQQTARRSLQPFLLLLLAWWGGTLLSFGLLIWRDQGVRWEVFLYPALCLGAGPALATFWSRGRAGKLLVILALVFVLARSITFYISGIANYRHW